MGYWIILGIAGVIFLIVAKPYIFSKKPAAQVPMINKSVSAPASKPNGDISSQVAPQPTAAQAPVTVPISTAFTAIVDRIGEGEIWVRPIASPDSTAIQFVVNSDTAIESVDYSTSSQPFDSSESNLTAGQDMPPPDPATPRLSPFLIQNINPGDRVAIESDTDSQGSTVATRIRRLASVK